MHFFLGALRINSACWLILHHFLSSTDIFFKISIQIKSFKNTISTKQFWSGSGQTFCLAWSGSKLFAKAISRQRVNTAMRSNNVVIRGSAKIYINYILANEHLLHCPIVSSMWLSNTWIMTCIILNDSFCQFKKGYGQSQAKVYMHEVLVYLSVKLVQKKVHGKVNWLSRHDHSCWLGCKTSNKTNNIEWKYNKANSTNLYPPHERLFERNM